jgi:hypothetical protein
MMASTSTTLTCQICLSPFSSADIPLDPCGHRVHMKCIYDSGRDKCPFCRAKLVLTNEERSRMKNVVYDTQPGLETVQLNMRRMNFNTPNLIIINNSHFYLETLNSFQMSRNIDSRYSSIILYENISEMFNFNGILNSSWNARNI